MKELTAANVTLLWYHLSKRYGSKVASKASSELMQKVAWALDLMGIMDNEKFMEQYATTIFDTIYLPFNVGDFAEVGPASQVVLAVHEHVHVMQCAREGSLEFCASYLALKSGRAHWEAEAYCASMQMIYYLNGQMPDIDRIARKILSYGCGQDEVEYIKAHLEMTAEPMRLGAIINDVAAEAIAFLER